MADWQPFALGVLGGSIADFLSVYAYRREKVRPHWVTSWFFWLMGLGMWLIGGTLAWSYHQQLPATNVILALHVGLSAPLILRRFTTQGVPGLG